VISSPSRVFGEWREGAVTQKFSCRCRQPCRGSSCVPPFAGSGLDQLPDCQRGYIWLPAPVGGIWQASRSLLRNAPAPVMIHAHPRHTQCGADGFPFLVCGGRQDDLRAQTVWNRRGLACVRLQHQAQSMSSVLLGPPRARPCRIDQIMARSRHGRDTAPARLNDAVASERSMAPALVSTVGIFYTFVRVSGLSLCK